MMKVVIAPDTFKESLSAADVAQAIGRGVLDACPSAIIDFCPMADGGEGTVDAMVAATSGAFVTADVFGPLRSPVRARFGMLGATQATLLPGEVGLTGAVTGAQGEIDSGVSRTAVLEMAAASGLALVPPELRDPRNTTTFGTGQLILAALDAGARDIIIGIGGSGTVDGGIGCAQALGVMFLDKHGQAMVCGLSGGSLGHIHDIDMSGIDPRVAGAGIRVACDVTNPLTGDNGSAAVYGPQKGATPEMVQQLDQGLRHLAHVIRTKLGKDVENIPGAGAAGGLGAGLVAFAGATLTPGLTMVAQAVGLARRLSGADLCITGEGRLDGQSSFGKTAVGVAGLATKAGVPTICIPGQATDDAPWDLFSDVCPLVAGDVTVLQAMHNTPALLQARAAAAMKAFLQK
jgi:glycerate kinase